MWLHRIIYFCALIGSFLYYVMYPHWIAWYLWVLVLLFAPFDLLISLPGMLTRRITLTVPNTLEIGEAGQLHITTLAKNRFLSGSLKIKLYVKSELVTACHRITCSGISGSCHSTDIDTSHCDVIHLTVKRFWACSLMGICALPISADYKAATVILPAPVRPPNYEPMSVPLRLFPKPGGGFSEDHEMRPYRTGDPVKMMHWKLSAKHDSLVVREALAPISLNRLIDVTPWNGPTEREMAISRLRWSSAHLLEKGFAHYVRIGEHGAVIPIAQSQDLTVFLYKTLVGADLPMLTYSPTFFTWVLRIDGKRVAG